jgi:hypothetical protein
MSTLRTPGTRGYDPMRALTTTGGSASQMPPAVFWVFGGGPVSAFFGRAGDVRVAHVFRCGRCGASFVARRSDRRFCSKACGDRARERVGTPIACRWCGSSFVPARSDRVYCSSECARALRRHRDRRTPCRIAGCGRPLRARGWCWTHHERWRRFGTPLAHVPIGELRPTRIFRHDPGVRWIGREARNRRRHERQMHAARIESIVELVFDGARRYPRLDLGELAREIAAIAQGDRLMLEEVRQHPQYERLRQGFRGQRRLSDAERWSMRERDEASFVLSFLDSPVVAKAFGDFRRNA